VIEGFGLTNHAKERCTERGISEDEVRRAVFDSIGDKPYPEVKLEVYKYGITVIYDHKARSVITVYKGRLKSWYTWIDSKESRRQHRVACEKKAEKKKRRKQA